MSSGSRRVVFAALGGNIAIAVAKLCGYFVSGSSAMLTEAIHSVVDSTDQVLLLIGESRARKARDGSHPLGYGLETYFWSFIVAVMVLIAGGAASLYQGVHRIMSPEPLTSLTTNLVVLTLAAIFEGTTFAIGYREYKRVVRGRPTPLWTFIKLSKDPSLYATLLEDFSALIGIGLATIGIVASTVFGLHWADGAASVAVGLLLVAVAIVLANETRSLIAGEAVAPPVMDNLQRVLNEDPRIAKVHELSTIHLGPRMILVLLTASFRDDMTLSDLRGAIRDVTRALKAIEDRIEYVYLRPRDPN
jgi:cation diffusion facilitator family transporter